MRSPAFLTGSIAALALTLAGCASLSSQEKSSYAQARSEVQQLEAEPLANQAAGDSLREARSALANADEAAKHHNGNDLMYWSYMATRHAQVGEAMVTELRAREQVAQANAERNRVLLENQRRQTELARQQAQQATQQAQSVQQQLEQQRQQAQQAQLAQQRQQAQQQVEQAQQRANAAQQALQQQQQQSQQKLAEAQQQAEQAQQAEQQTRDQLQQLQAKQTAQGMVLTLSGPLLFRTGSSTLEPGAAHSLADVADVLQQHPMMKVRIEGFTDNREWHRRAMAPMPLASLEPVSADARTPRYPTARTAHCACRRWRVPTGARARLVRTCVPHGG